MIFKNLFRKNKLQTPVDLSAVATDIHSHIIPGIDDGALDVNESLLLVKKLHELGYKNLILTPHISGDYFRNDFHSIEPAFLDLENTVVEANIPVQLTYAAEYMLDSYFTDKIEEKNFFTFASNHVLIELSYFSPPTQLNEILFKLQLAGYQVVLAHPERYMYWHSNIKQYEELKNRDVLFQMNLFSIIGAYTMQAQQMAQKLIDMKMIDFLGTDLHQVKQLSLFEECLYEPYLDKLVSSGKLRNAELINIKS